MAIDIAHMCFFFIIHYFIVKCVPVTCQERYIIEELNAHACLFRLI